MPVEYCCYGGERQERCLQWLEQNLPRVHAEVTAEPLQEKPTSVHPIVVLDTFSDCIRNKRSATVEFIDELKKLVVKESK